MSYNANSTEKQQDIFTESFVTEAPTKGITCDAAHSTKRGITEYQAHDLKSGDRIFYKNLGNQTVNIGEFLAIVDSIKYIIENNHPDKIIYSDSVTAITWVKNKKTASNKRNSDLKKAEIYLKVMSYYIDDIKIIHWDNKIWGEIPSDFGNK